MYDRASMKGKHYRLPAYFGTGCEHGILKKHVRCEFHEYMSVGCFTVVTRVPNNRGKILKAELEPKIDVKQIIPR